MADAPARGRHTFGPVVLLGLVSAGVAAWSGGQGWAWDNEVTIGLTHLKSSGAVVGGPPSPSAHAPVVTAVAFVVLASWGVVLVTRGRVRRVLTVFTLVAAAGLVAAALSAFGSAPARLREALAQVGGHPSPDLHRTPTAWVGVVVCLVALVAAAAAVRYAGSWPEMGARYDAPGAEPEPVDPGEASSIDIWRALDEGRDPTLPDPRRDAP